MSFALWLVPGGAWAAGVEGRHHIELRAPIFESREMVSCEQIVELSNILVSNTQGSPGQRFTLDAR